LLSYLLTNPEVLALVGWVGTIVGIVSLIVTIAGFWVALIQLRRVKKSAEAAGEAVAALRKTVHLRELNGKLTHALAQLRSAALQLSRDNRDAAMAYLDAASTSLIDARELSRDEGESEKITDGIVQVQRGVERIQRGGSSFSPAKLAVELRRLVGSIDQVAARVRYHLE
jgi:hypothetical protein